MTLKPSSPQPLTRREAGEAEEGVGGLQKHLLLWLRSWWEGAPEAGRQQKIGRPSSLPPGHCHEERQVSLTWPP